MPERIECGSGRDGGFGAAAHARRARPRFAAALTGLAACVAIASAGCTNGGAGTGAFAATGATPASAPVRYGLGQPVTEASLAAWNIDVAPDGRGLPPGSGSVAHGGQVYAQKCAMCHGAKGEGGAGDALVGGIGTLADKKPKKTVGSYWPYATTLFDYIRRAMPYNAPGSLSADDVYAVSAFLLNRNGIVPDGTTLDATTLPQVRMPNRDGFVPDPRGPGKL
ncbi:c-type cytochrome [Burkholderia plantarii]|uniref:c-type cytochrome n=1 Tax=Burkholderia plantarii TaxID=41899 RepID=UPI0009F6EC5A|nr:cytochrome c [Burkholderia plantarii]